MEIPVWMWVILAGSGGGLLFTVFNGFDIPVVLPIDSGGRRKKLFYGGFGRMVSGGIAAWIVYLTSYFTQIPPVVYVVAVLSGMAGHSVFKRILFYISLMDAGKKSSNELGERIKIDENNKRKKGKQKKKGNKRIKRKSK